MSDFTSERRLCDDAGMVGAAQVEGDEFLTYRGQINRLRALTGLAPVDQDFPCTGSAHLAGEHIRCTSPAHVTGITPGGSTYAVTSAPFDLEAAVRLARAPLTLSRTLWAVHPAWADMLGL